MLLIWDFLENLSPLTNNLFHSLPFGLSSSGYIFTKTIRPIVKYLRSKGEKVVKIQKKTKKQQ